MSEGIKAQSGRWIKVVKAVLRVAIVMMVIIWTALGFTLGAIGFEGVGSLMVGFVVIASLITLALTHLIDRWVYEYQHAYDDRRLTDQP